MRYVLVLAILILLTGCSDMKPYTKADLTQVRQAYATIRPIYLAFRKAYYQGNGREMMREYHRERIACRQVDVIDNRDTIDPNVNLFQASIGLDNFCNDIESAYAGWAKKHGYAYDKAVVPSLPLDAFKDGDASMLKMPEYLRRPAALA